jgi:hypothetical protein
MKNKLLTTALVTSMIGAGVTASVAQTTVSGNLDLSYMAVAAKGTGSAGTPDSFRGFGKESQINIANKGKLNNGMDYAAGFSIEMDGPDAGQTGMFEENVYIDIISGNTTLTFGSDHIQNPDVNPTNIAGFGYIAVDSTRAGVATTGLYPKGANSPYSAYGAGVMQKTPIGTFSALYVPTNNTNVGALNDIHNSSSAAAAEPTTTRGTSESAYELGFRGDLGVKGLTALAFMNKSDQRDTVTSGGDEKGRRFSVTYVTGPFSIAGDYVKTEGTTTGAAATAGQAGEKVSGKSIGLGYAITPNLTASVTRAKADTNATGRAADEEIDILALGYSLGPVAVSAQAKRVDNLAGNAGTDADVLAVRISTKF